VSRAGDNAEPAGTAAPTVALALGEEQYRAGAYVEAAAIFGKICNENPGFPTPLRLLGLCRLRLGDPQDGLALLEKARALAPFDPYAQLHYGIGLHAVGRHREAAEIFASCRAELPSDPAPHLNLASALLALGQSAAAVDAARRARRRAPKLPQAHYMLGQALLAAGRLGEAATAFSDCLRLAPGFADAWVNLGVVHYRKSEIETAKNAMRRALTAAPGHRAAGANLGAFLRLTGEVEAGETLLRELVARDPVAAEARLNLAADLLQEERPGEALALLDEAPVPTEPRLACHWVLQRSLALLQVGRANEAREALAGIDEVPAVFAPLLLWRRILLALSARDHDTARRLADEMETAIDSRTALLPEHRIMAHYDLAKFWSGQGVADRAFRHWRDGHRQLGRMQPFSRLTTKAFFDAQIAAFSRARLRLRPRAKNRDAAPVFIVGMPRSGTTLAEQIIAAHPQAFGAGERPALGRAYAALGGTEGASRIAAIDRKTLDAAAEAYLAELHALAPQADRIVDKMPGNFNYLGLAALMLPGARIIHCARDPRDIGLSIFTFRFYGYHPYAHDLADLGWYIGEYNRLMAHWYTALANPILTVQLTDWVNDFTGTLRRVLDFLGLPYDADCERFYEQDSRVRTVSRSQVRQPVNARGIGRWRPYEKELQPLIAELKQADALPKD
jgi:tetratricopeptide (TPR) repeat protein